MSPLGHPFRPAPAQDGQHRTQRPDANDTHDANRPSFEEDERLQREKEWAQQLNEAKAIARQEGIVEGRQAGMAQALAEGRETLKDVSQALDAGLSQIDAERKAIRECLAETAISLGIRIAEKLVGLPSAFDRDDLSRRLIEQVEDKITSQTEVVCRAHPSTATRIEALFGGRIIVESDQSMEAGGIIVELRNVDGRQVVNRWNASIEHQLAALKALEPRS